MSWTVSNLQRPFREDFSLKKSGIIAEKESQIFGRRFVGFDEPKKRRPFSISKRALAAASETAGRRKPLCICKMKVDTHKSVGVYFFRSIMNMERK